ncbi:MAG TPA: glycine zipper 2TM domain-containing protein [Limnobacter sp.]|uniref:glycine zipper 2TM domain-containing protein n=1 Tax=Limnobacter sp. TaxID=2003368 RepID=UPI002EDA7EB1
MSNRLNSRIKTTAIVAFIALTGLAGCATQSTSGQVYREGEARRAQIIEQGVVESVRNVTIQGDTNNVGTLAGGVLGGMAGSNIGGGSGRAAGAILGAVAGGIAGQAAERNLSNRPGLEITVKMDNGTLRAYVQDADEQFRPGERVRIVSNGGVSRVSH